MEKLNVPEAPRETQEANAPAVAPLEELSQQPSEDEDSVSIRLSRANDADRNARTRLPPGEVVRLYSIRITEIFFPSHVRQLMNGLKALGWLDTNKYGEHESLGDWISSTRSPLGGLSWRVLGTVYPLGTAPPAWRMSAQRWAERVLPLSLKSIEFELTQIIPSVTAIVGEFVLNDESAESLNPALSSDYATEHEPNEVGYLVLSPELLRERETTRRRREIRDDCAAIMRQFFAGFFAEEADPAAYPSVDFISTKKTAVVPLATSRETSFLDALAINGYTDTFCDESRSVLLVWDPAMRPASRAITLMVTEAEERPADSRLPIGVLSHGTCFSVLALRDALIDVIHEVGDLRDALSLGEAKDFLPNNETIRMVEIKLVSLGADLRPVISELEEADVLERLKGDLPSFVGLDQKFNNIPLSEAITMELRLGARNLGRAQQDLSLSVQTLSSLMSARASSALTRSNRMMQVIALVIAVASLVVAVVKSTR